MVRNARWQDRKYNSEGPLRPEAGDVVGVRKSVPSVCDLVNTSDQHSGRRLMCSRARSEVRHSSRHPRPGRGAKNVWLRGTALPIDRRTFTHPDRQVGTTGTAMQPAPFRPRQGRMDQPGFPAMARDAGHPCKGCKLWGRRMRRLKKSGESCPSMNGRGSILSASR
jgi:hypothetical protein